MKHGHALAIGLLALALVACGGSGSHHDTSTGTVATTTDYRIETTLTDTTNVTPRDLNGGYLYPDPLSLQRGSLITFQLVNYTGSGSSLVRNVVSSGVTFDSSAPSSVGTVAADGLFAAASDTNGTSYVVSASYQGQSYATAFQVNPIQILLRGRVRDGVSGAPVYNAEIDFYGPQNLEDATSPVVLKAVAHTAFNGSFIASIPTPAASATTVAQAQAQAQITFTVSNAHLPTGYAPSFVYRGTTYAAGSILAENRPLLVSQNVVTDPTSGETAFLPFVAGDRYLVDSPSDNVSTTDVPTLTGDGTILLTPASS